MKKTNKTKFAILGMLFDQPRSGYQIRQFMLESTNHFWQESDASIYPMLKKLEAEQLVTSKCEFVGKRERKIFEITEAGKKEFSGWLALPAEEETHRSELLLKLFFGAHTTKEECLEQLSLHLKRVLETKKVFEHIETDSLSQIPDEHPHKLFWIMALRNGIIQVNAELQWLTECFKILEKR